MAQRAAAQEARQERLLAGETEDQGMQSSEAHTLELMNGDVLILLRMCRGGYSRLEAIEAQLGKHSRYAKGEVNQTPRGAVRQQDCGLCRLRGISRWPASKPHRVLPPLPLLFLLCLVFSVPQDSWVRASTVNDNRAMLSSYTVYCRSLQVSR